MASKRIKKTNLLKKQMNNCNAPNDIASHYQKVNLLERVVAALKKKNRSLANLDLKDLAAFDELHLGGKAASRALASKAKLNPGALILDVGSGVGGPARLLTVEFGMQVVGLDLTESFCHVAYNLSRAVGVENNLGFITGNALKIPFKSEMIDTVWSQHCAMNIRDKKSMYAEFRRVIKPDGQLLIHDVAAGSNQPVVFPVPWAATGESSFLETPSDLKQIIGDAGFEFQQWEDVTEQALAWFDSQKRGQSSPVLSQRLVFGDSLKTMANNMKTNLKEHRIKVIQAICIPR